MSCALIEESDFSKKFDVPFFTMYKLYTDYSGEKWMNVKYAEIEGTKINYIKQNTPPKNEIINSYGKLDSSFNTIFMPHYWNKTGLVPGNKHGNLQIYYVKNGSFVNLSDDEINNQTDEICSLAVEQNGFALQYVIKQTDEICSLAVKSNGNALCYVQNHTDHICSLAIEQNSDAVKYCML